MGRNGESFKHEADEGVGDWEAFGTAVALQRQREAAYGRHQRV